MKCVCTFDKYRDLREVEPFGFVDLVKANQTSTIDVPLNAVELSYNEIEDPKAIGSRPSDNFEEIQGHTVIANYTPPKDNETPSAE